MGRFAEDAAARIVRSLSASFKKQGAELLH